MKSLDLTHGPTGFHVYRLLRHLTDALVTPGAETEAPAAVTSVGSVASIHTLTVEAQPGVDRLTCIQVLSRLGVV